MKRYGQILVLLLFLASLLVLFMFKKAPGAETPEGAKFSQQTGVCITCHKIYTPGIVEDYMTSRHSRNTPGEAALKPALERRVSFKGPLDPALSGVVVGCYECHGRNPEAHKDTFDHFGLRIHVVVSSGDCATCHPVEEGQYRESKKAYAHTNLEANPVYNALYSTIIGVKSIVNGSIVTEKPIAYTKQDTCFACHGLPVGVEGMKEIDTQAGKISVPNLTNWPNMGVGRVNPDGTRGSCTACHPRHGFSIEVARKPYTCAQCHLEPDVPGWDVYSESKHGDIFFSLERGWNFTNVPWRPGVDFKTPSCAVCHNSLLVSPDGQVIAERNHNFGGRLWVRLFGLIYSTAQPKSGNTSIIRNKDGLPLPATFGGEPASAFLINAQEQANRRNVMETICRSCHNRDWVEDHFRKVDSTIKQADRMTAAATAIVSEAWSKGLADKTNPFDEGIEQDWITQWLFYANSAKYASAMTGAPDYASFKNGFWGMTYNLRHMKEELETLELKHVIGRPPTRP